VIIATSAPSLNSAMRSVSWPSTTAATASSASRRPIDAARSSDVEPAGSSRALPSGSRTVIEDMAIRVYGRLHRGDCRSVEKQAEERARLGDVLPADRRLVDSGEGAGGVEIVGKAISDRIDAVAQRSPGRLTPSRHSLS
jgi:hypothetical protein